MNLCLHLAQGKGGVSLNTNVNVSTERRNSLSKEDQKKNAARRQSMLAVTDIKKMQKMDSRKNSVTDGGKKASRRGLLQ